MLKMYRSEINDRHSSNVSNVQIYRWYSHCERILYYFSKFKIKYVFAHWVKIENMNITFVLVTHKHYIEYYIYILKI